MTFIMFIVSDVVAVVANRLVICVMFLKKKRINSVEILIIYLACVDIIFTLTVHPIMLAATWTTFDISSNGVLTK